VIVSRIGITDIRDICTVLLPLPKPRRGVLLELRDAAASRQEKWRALRRKEQTMNIRQRLYGFSVLAALILTGPATARETVPFKGRSRRMICAAPTPSSPTRGERNWINCRSPLAMLPSSPPSAISGPIRISPMPPVTICISTSGLRLGAEEEIGYYPEIPLPFPDSEAGPVAARASRR